MGVSKNRGGPPKWMVKIMENPIKMDDLGVHLFFETPKWHPFCGNQNLMQSFNLVIFGEIYPNKKTCIVWVWCQFHDPKNWCDKKMHLQIQGVIQLDPLIIGDHNILETNTKKNNVS